MMFQLGTVVTLSEVLLPSKSYEPWSRGHVMPSGELETPYLLLRPITSKLGRMKVGGHSRIKFNDTLFAWLHDKLKSL